MVYNRSNTFERLKNGTVNTHYMGTGFAHNAKARQSPHPVMKQIQKNKAEKGKQYVKEQLSQLTKWHQGTPQNGLTHFWSPLSQGEMEKLFTEVKNEYREKDPVLVQEMNEQIITNPGEQASGNRQIYLRSFDEIPDMVGRTKILATKTPQEEQVVSGILDKSHGKFSEAEVLGEQNDIFRGLICSVFGADLMGTAINSFMGRHGMADMVDERQMNASADNDIAEKIAEQVEERPPVYSVPKRQFFAINNGENDITMTIPYTQGLGLNHFGLQVLKKICDNFDQPEKMVQSAIARRNDNGATQFISDSTGLEGKDFRDHLMRTFQAQDVLLEMVNQAEKYHPDDDQLVGNLQLGCKYVASSASALTEVETYLPFREVAEQARAVAGNIRDSTDAFINDAPDGQNMDAVYKKADLAYEAVDATFGGIQRVLSDSSIRTEKEYGSTWLGSINDVDSRLNFDQSDTDILKATYNVMDRNLYPDDYQSSKREQGIKDPEKYKEYQQKLQKLFDMSCDVILGKPQSTRRDSMTMD